MLLDRARHLLRSVPALALTAALAATALAADGIPVCTVTQNQFAPAAVADGSGGMYVAWLDQRLGYNTDIYLQRVTGSLKRATGWPDGGVAMTLVTCTKSGIALAADSLGVLATWSDNRCNGAIGFDIYAVRFTPQGARAAGWPSNGRLVYSANSDQLNPAIASDGAGGAFIAWTDLGVFPFRLAAQHVLANGTLDPAWPANGLVLADIVPDSCAATVLADGAGGAWVAWQDIRAGSGDLWLQRLAADGTPAAGWPVGGSAIVTAAGTQFAPQLTSDTAGGVFVTWSDRRSGTTQVYAQRRDATGALVAGWSAQGDAIGPGGGEQGRARAIADGAGGLFVAWQDHRSGTAAAYAQRLGSAPVSVTPWPAAGLAVAANAAAQTAPTLAADSAGGVFVTWHDARSFGVSGADLWATRLDATGALVGGWPASGTPVCDAAAEQREARLVGSAAGRALVAWTDARASATRGTDIAMALLGPSGPAAHHVLGIAAVHHDGQTFLTWEPPPGTGWNFRVYRAESPIVTSADLAGATLVGAVGDSSAYDRHFSQVRGQAYGYAVDSLATPLDPASGLFVFTTSGNANAYYAVTSQNSVFSENTTVQAGVTALSASVTELLARPRPVFQRQVEINGRQPRFWALFVSDHDTPLMQAMANRSGVAYVCGVLAPPAIPYSQTTLLLSLHYRGGSVLDATSGTGYPGEWVLGFDDWMPNGQNSFWYGYADSYDITSPALTSLTSGTVVDYTLRRVEFTLDWALRTFPLDTARVYSFGYSMGGAGSILLATHLGDRVAASMSVVGKSDFSFAQDPDTSAWFNPNGSFRKLANAMWGTLAANLPASEGGQVYEQLDAGWLAEHGTREFAPLYLFAGKRDVTMGWAENIPLFQSFQDAGQGVALYWDMRQHAETSPTHWSPIQDPRMMYAHALDQSYPSPTRCSFDDEPGDGSASDGDTTGTINGHFEWDAAGVDSAAHWSHGVSLRTLTTTAGLRVPPDSCTCDITLRRTRRFLPEPDEVVSFTVHDIGTGLRLAQSGTAIAGANGRVTLPGVKVFRQGSVIDVWRDGVLAVEPALALAPGIACTRHPVRGVAQLAVTWPGSGAARSALYDVSGRLVRVLWSGTTRASTQSIALDGASLAPGLYFVSAEAGGRRVSRRLVVLH